MKKAIGLIAIDLVCVASLFIGLGHGQARAATSQKNSPVVEVQQAVHHDVSRPLSALISSQAPGQEHTQPLRLLPVAQGANAQPDPVVQSSTPGPKVGTTAGLSFDGVGDTSNTPSNPCDCAPSD